MSGRSDEHKIQTDGREGNAAQPLNAAKDNEGAERYPSVSKDDGVEKSAGENRSFGDNPEPRRGAGDTSTPPSANEGRLGPGADPVEGKR